MWNTTEFGNTGGGFPQSGGGFFNTSTAASPSQEKKKGQPDRLTNVIPCTIAQIIAMPEDEENLKVGSISAKIITFVGLVHAIDSQSTRMSFLVNDTTAQSIEVQVWIGENAEMERRLRGIQENAYVRVTGAVRSMKGKRHVIAFKIVPISDYNEITVHALEVIHVGKSIAAMDNEQPMDTGNSFNPMGMGIGMGMPMKQESTNAFNGLSKPQQVVMQYISGCSDPQGVSIHDLFSNIKTLTKPIIKEALEFLSNEGHIYSTIDDEHFTTTDSN